MRSFSDLSDAEVLALSDQEIAFYCDLACAEAGVPLLPLDPGPEPTKPACEPDRTVYDVSGEVFFDAGEAAEVCAVLNRMKRVELRYVPGPGYTQIAHACTREIVVSPKRHYSPEAWERVRSEVTTYETRKATYEKATRERAEIQKKRDAACEWVATRVEDVREEARERAGVAAEFARYVTLAGGDEAMARRFFEKAHPDRVRFLPAAEKVVVPA